MLQGDTLAPYQFIICPDYVLRTSVDLLKENGFTLAKKRSRRYPVQTITDADYADRLALQVESPLRSPERATSGISLDENTDKTEYLCLNQRGDISTLNSSSLKFVE